VFILAFDLATRSGLAYGPSDGTPKTEAVILKDDESVIWTAHVHGGRWLRDSIKRVEVFGTKVDVIAIEAPLPTGAHRSANAAALATGLVAVFCDNADRLSIPIYFCHTKTVAGHFTGVSVYNDREKKKAATLARAKQLGWLPPDSKDKDKADALAVWSYAAHRWGGRRPQRLEMFGQGAL
jgi:hypothetical protein